MSKPIQVYADTNHTTLVASFNTAAELEAYAEQHGTMADCCVVNGLTLMGWDELDTLLECYGD